MGDEGEGETVRIRERVEEEVSGKVRLRLNLRVSVRLSVRLSVMKRARVKVNEGVRVREWGVRGDGGEGKVGREEGKVWEGRGREVGNGNENTVCRYNGVLCSSGICS